MPELPEVETVRLSLMHRLQNKTIKNAHILDNRLIKYNNEQPFIERLTGRTVKTLQRRGKFLIAKLDNNENLIIHLAMTGVFLHSPTNNFDHFPKTVTDHLAVTIQLSDDTYMVYSDYRRFGSIRVVSDHDMSDRGLTHLKILQEMGPEPLEDGIAEEFISRIRQNRYRNKPIKDILLDQRVIAGVGNIYASEILFPAKIHPAKDVKDVTNEELLEILKHTKTILELSISLGGSSIRDYVDGDGKAGSFQDHHKVYNKEECVECGNDIYYMKINNRMTYFCTTCQPFNN